MATINDFKREISELVKAQKAAKRINHQSEVYRNRGLLHAMYVAYYILKHKLIGEAMNEYLAKVIKEWKSLETQGWCGYSKMYSGEKYFRERVDSLIDAYSDEETVCADRPEA